MHHADLGAAIVALENNVPILSHDHSGTGTRATNKLLQTSTHQTPDTDNGSSSLHHTLGPGSFQAASGSHLHAGQYMPVESSAPGSGTQVVGRYWANTNQTINAVTNTPVSFPLTDHSTPLVVTSVSGTGTNFNIRRAGVWGITSVVRFNVLPAGGGETYASINANGSDISASGGASSNTVNTRCVSLMDYLPFNTNIIINAWQAPISGTASVALASSYPWVFCVLTWLHD